MPITKELDNINELENAGFDHKQSKTLAKIIEQSHTDSQENLKEFFRNELNNQIHGLDSKLTNQGSDLDSRLTKKLHDLDSKLTNQMNGLESKLTNQMSGLDYKLTTEIKNLEIRMMETQKDLLIKLFGIIVGSLTVAVTILKLFP